MFAAIRKSNKAVSSLLKILTAKTGRAFPDAENSPLSENLQGGNSLTNTNSGKHINAVNSEDDMFIYGTHFI